MWNYKKAKSKNKSKKVISVVFLIAFLIVFRGRLIIVTQYFDNLIKTVNFQLVNVKSSIYKTKLSFESKMKDIKYLDNYIKDNNDRNFELQKTKLKNIELEKLRLENEKLRTMLDMKSKKESEYIVADVSLVESSDSKERFFINKGKNEGVVNNLPVLYDGYLIGKITKVGNTYSEVTLLTSKDAKISVVLNNNEMQILRGNGDGTFSIYNYNESVIENQQFNIETSGMSDVFPRGLKIGTYVIKDLNAFNQMRELNFKPFYKVYNIQSVLVYKWTPSSENNNELQNEINKGIEDEFQKNKDSSEQN